jgi:hypothetical protein
MLPIINFLKARKILWLMPGAILSIFLINFTWILIGIASYMILFRWFTLTYHEYQVHKFIKPNNVVVEAIGYFILAVWEWQSPAKKINFHELHHDYYQDNQLDPTIAKLNLTDNAILYCLDLTPHSDIPYADMPPIAIETQIYKWFNKHWVTVLTTTIVAWLLLLPFWTFMVFYWVPMFFWNIIYRTTDWTCHKICSADRPWACLYLGTSAYHGRHHNDNSYNKDTYYGIGFWKYLNIDFYITRLFFKTFDHTTHIAA